MLKYEEQYYLFKQFGQLFGNCVAIVFLKVLQNLKQQFQHTTKARPKSR